MFPPHQQHLKILIPAYIFILTPYVHVHIHKHIPILTSYFQIHILILTPYVPGDIPAVLTAPQTR